MILTVVIDIATPPKNKTKQKNNTICLCDQCLPHKRQTIWIGYISVPVEERMERMIYLFIYLIIENPLKPTEGAVSVYNLKANED